MHRLPSLGVDSTKWPLLALALARLVPNLALGGGDSARPSLRPLKVQAATHGTEASSAIGIENLVDFDNYADTGLGIAIQVGMFGMHEEARP